MAEQTPQPEDQHTPSADDAQELPTQQPGTTPTPHPDEALQGVEAAMHQLNVVSGRNGSTCGTDRHQADAGDTMSLLGDVSLRVKIELGRTRMYIEDVLKLNEHSIIELDRAAGDPVDIYVNDRHIARGEVLVVNDNFCVRVSELVNDDAAVLHGAEDSD